jgi:hypothetical protein
MLIAKNEIIRLVSKTYKDQVLGESLARVHFPLVGGERESGTEKCFGEMDRMLN